MCLMQRRLIDKIYTGSLVFSLFITNAAVADSYTEKLMLKHSPQLLAGQWNPWLLPEVPEKKTDFQCPADWQSEQSQDGSAGRQGQGQAPEFKKRLSGRFVTPGILESLKQQQIQTQMTPSYESYRQRPQQRKPQQRMQQQPVTRLPENRNYYGEPSYGMGSANPLYDVPTVSPWGSGSDVIYRGGSFPGALPGSSPWVPNEAIGGLPPIHVPPFGGSSNWGELNSTGSDNAEADNTEKRLDNYNNNNVFNPFTFVPNKSWR